MNTKKELIECLEDTKRQLEMCIERIPLQYLSASMCEQVSKCVQVLEKAKAES